MSDKPEQNAEETQRIGEDGQKNPGGEGENLSGLYEKMAKELRERLEHAGEVTGEALDKAMHETREWAGKMREHYQEDIERVSQYLRRDMEAAVRRAADETRRAFDAGRLQAGFMGLVSSLAHKAGEQFERWAKSIDRHITYNTGEVTGPGTLVCTACGQEMHMEETSHIPPCPRCHHSEFHRHF